MLNWNLLQNILIIAIACGSITVVFIQKTKRFCNGSNHVPVYSLIVNVVLGFLFSKTFSDISHINSLWVGLFSFLGADTIYKSLEGKLSTYEQLTGKTTDVSVDDDTTLIEEVIGNDNDKVIGVDNIIGEITYE